jgi:hypothetical protein
MPLVGIESGGAVRQYLREQARRSNWHDPILLSMPQEQPLKRDLLGVETPGPD